MHHDSPRALQVWILPAESQRGFVAVVSVGDQELPRLEEPLDLGDLRRIVDPPQRMLRSVLVPQTDQAGGVPGGWRVTVRSKGKDAGHRLSLRGPARIVKADPPALLGYTGLVGIQQELIDEIVRRIRAQASPSRIILFGSAASGRMTRDSDVDLLVVEPEVSDIRAEMVRLGGALLGLGYSIDVKVIGAERFEETKDIIGGIAYPAHKYGKVIYEAA